MVCWFVQWVQEISCTSVRSNMLIGYLGIRSGKVRLRLFGAGQTWVRVTSVRSNMG